MILSTRRPQLNHGISRREVVIVAVIVSVGMLLLITHLNRQRSLARRNLCELRQMRLAQSLWVIESQQGGFPGFRGIQAIDAQGEPVAASWVFPALPYISPPPSNAEAAAQQKWFEQQLKGEADEIGTGPYAQVYDDYGPDAPPALRGTPPALYIPELVCPTNPPGQADSAGWLSYVVNSGMPDMPATDEAPADWPANGIFLDHFPGPGRMAKQVTLRWIEDHDGLSYTLLLTENFDSGRWTESDEALVGFVWVANLVDARADPGDQLLRINRQIGEGDGSIKFARPSSYHPGGVNVVHASGATRFLAQDIDYLVFAQLMTPDGHDIKRAGSLTPLGPPYQTQPDSGGD